MIKSKFRTVFFISQFPMPEETHTMNLQVSKVQPFMRPSVLPLSETLCRDSQIVLLEPKIESKLLLFCCNWCLFDDLRRGQQFLIMLGHVVLLNDTTQFL